MTDPSEVPPLITIGETMALVAPTDAEPLLSAERFQLALGGAESNVAMHVAALGHHVAWVSALGEDVLGERVLSAIREVGVDVRWVRRDPHAMTGVYFKDPGHGVLYYRAGSAASRMNRETFADVPFEKAKVVHTSGITPVLSTSCAEALDDVFRRVAASGGVLSFDVNHRPALWSASEAAPVLKRFAESADLVFVGRDEAETLWGCETAEQIRTVLPRPRVLVVKDGAVGATEFSPEGEVFVPAIPTEVVEPVGAGDAFAAGYLAAMLSGEDACDRLMAGHRRASLVLRSTSDLA